MPDATNVREMFSRITPRYDFLNHLLSLNLDRLWRRALVREGLSHHPGRILDLATGTGDVAIQFRAMSQDPFIAGADYCLPMLACAPAKAAGEKRIAWAAADALRLPFKSGAFDLVTIAFGLRNFADIAAGLSEIRRVTAPGGRLLVLEFSMDLAPWFSLFYKPYFRHVLPRVGRWLSGSGAYAYLCDSVEQFPKPADVLRAICEAGFPCAEARTMTGGSVVLYAAE